MSDTREVVKTTVPAPQKQTWADHADELDMSLAEYLRCMTQAGRSKIEAFDRDDSQDGEASAMAPR